MAYPEKLLNPGEQVVVDVVPHWKYLLRPAVVVILVLAGAIVALQLQPQPPRWPNWPSPVSWSCLYSGWRNATSVG